MEREEIIELCGNDNALFFDNPSFDKSIVGYSEDGRIIYDYDKMISELSESDSMDEIDAIEFIEYNTIRSLPYAGSNAPIILHLL